MQPSGSNYAPASSNGSFSPQLSLKSSGLEELDSTIGQPEDNQTFNLQINISELQMVILPQSFNYGLFLPPCDLRAGKFLLEDRPIRSYPFHDCAPYVELKYKKRVYKMSNLDKKDMKNLHQPKKLNKFIGYVENRNAVKVEKKCSKGLDPNFHDEHGETPLTLAAGIENNRNVLVQLIGGGAHLDFRNSEGQTAMHKAAFLSLIENVKTLLELGASPHYKDLIGLTPLYYNMITKESNVEIAELLLKEMAEVFIVDMQFNLPIHQACKNGLTKHLDLLLLYGSNINAQNINGNTPLHVCAVHNRVECCRILLYRGADRSILNKQGESAFDVANLLNNFDVSEAIKSHDPSRIVPFNVTPKYNTNRRRLTYSNASQQIERRRSLSHSSMSSMQSSDRYQVPQMINANSFNNNKNNNNNNNGIYASTTNNGKYNNNYNNNNNNSDIYGTLKFAPDTVQALQPGFEANIPRILVIPRGTKGFGFILRGANHREHEMEFEPSEDIPALQFFEGVDKTGMAMRAGLRPGDFLLEINGIDVRCANHAQVVELIHQAEDTITLKVITIERGFTRENYVSGLNRKPSIQIANQNINASGLPPMPPQRNPVTSLTFGRVLGSGSAFKVPQHETTINNIQAVINSNYQASQYYQNSQIPPPPQPSQASTFSTTQYIHNNYSDGMLPPPPPPPPPNTSSIYQSSSSSTHHHQHHQRQLSTNSCNITNESQQQLPTQQMRCASVKSRSSPARRISAAELEHLMIRQNAAASTSQFQPISYEQQEAIKQGSKKFTSVAEMKRRKQRQPNQIDLNDREIYAESPNGEHQRGGGGPFALKSFNSSPDLQQIDSTISNYHISKQQLHSEDDYSKPFKPILRPKTPPPPPPPLEKLNLLMEKSVPQLNRISNTRPAQEETKTPPTPPPPPTSIPIDYEPTISLAVNNPSEIDCASKIPPPAPPPPPPPPPPAAVAAFLTKPFSKPSTETVSKSPLKAANVEPPEKTAKTADCRGISAEALLNVKLKPITVQKLSALSVSNSSSLKNSSKPVVESDSSSVTPEMKKNVDFDMDLKSALARRRSKVNVELSEEIDSLKNSTNNSTTTTTTMNPVVVKEATTTIVGRNEGLSLRESVRENVQAPLKNNGKLEHHHSPTCGFATKKDSGYTSSRTSLEPSECGDEPQTSALLINGGVQQQQTINFDKNTLRISIDSTKQSPNSTNISSTDTSSKLNCVTLISQQLEDNYGTLNVKKLPSLSEDNTELPKSSSTTMNGRILFLENPLRTPPIDYEDDEYNDVGIATTIPTTTTTTTGPDSGNGDSDHEFDVKKLLNEDGNGLNFGLKPLVEWSTVNVCEWLNNLKLLEDYGKIFDENRITGAELVKFDRTKFTRLGVTRIAHRQAMEKSLKDLCPPPLTGNNKK